MVAVKVQIVTQQPGVPQQVTIDMEESSRVIEIKHQLLLKTQIPIEHQEVLVRGLSHLYLIDNRTNIGVEYIGTTNAKFLIVNKAVKEAGAKAITA